MPRPEPVAATTFPRKRRWIQQRVPTMDNKTLEGALVGAAISIVTFFVKANVENRRVARRALFNLLEIWWRIRLLNIVEPEMLATALVKLMTEQGIEISETDYSEGVPILGLIFRELIGKHAAVSERLSKQFAKCVAELSQVKPVLAFQISGRDELKQLLSDIEQSQAQLISAVPIPETQRVAARTFQETINNAALTEILSTLESDIYSVAWSAGILDLLSTYRAIRGYKKQAKQPLLDLLGTETRAQLGESMRALVTASQSDSSVI